MTAPYHPYYLGPAGGLTAIPLSETVTPNILPVQAVNTSIDGTATVERFGSKRSWKLDYKGLTEDLEAMLTLAMSGALAGPLYLVDPLTTNLLAPEVASTGSSAYTRSPFTTSSTGLSASLVSTTPPYAVTPGLSTQLTCTNTSGATQTLFTPAIPVGPVAHTWSLYVKTTAAATTQLFDGAAVVGTASTDTHGSWTRVSVTGTSATGTLQPRLVVPTDTTVQVSAMQLEPGTAPSPWRPGGGVCRVYVASMDRSSVLWPYRDNSVTIVEV